MFIFLFFVSVLFICFESEKEGVHERGAERGCRAQCGARDHRPRDRSRSRTLNQPSPPGAPAQVFKHRSSTFYGREDTTFTPQCRPRENQSLNPRGLD